MLRSKAAKVTSITPYYIPDHPNDTYDR